MDSLQAPILEYILTAWPGWAVAVALIVFLFRSQIQVILPEGFTAWVADRKARSAADQEARKQAMVNNFKDKQEAALREHWREDTLFSILKDNQDFQQGLYGELIEAIGDMACEITGVKEQVQKTNELLINLNITNGKLADAIIEKKIAGKVNGTVKQKGTNDAVQTGTVG